MVPPNHRGKGFGISLAKSFLYYAPRLGYQASVFNLVYVNNDVSVKYAVFPWIIPPMMCNCGRNSALQKVSLIPRAGRLRRKDGQGEEYVELGVL